MRNVRVPMIVLLGLGVALAATQPTAVDADRGDDQISILDNCDPGDPGWADTGGCALRRGDVGVLEFQALLTSPLYDNNATDPNPLVGRFLVGHPSWRNEPGHTVIESGKRLHIKNEGGRLHTFTPVAEFGGGRPPILRVGTTIAPECVPPPAGTPDRYEVAPGARIRLRLEAEEETLQRFQCCIHPWMRATVKIKPKEHDGH